MIGYRPLKYPARPGGLPDDDGEWDRYWRQNRIWWDNWAHNFVLSIILWPALAALAIVLLAVLA